MSKKYIYNGTIEELKKRGFRIEGGQPSYAMRDDLVDPNYSVFISLNNDIDWTKNELTHNNLYLFPQLNEEAIQDLLDDGLVDIE